MTITESSTVPAHETVWSLTNAVVPACCLHLVAEAGIADRLDGPVDVVELAETCSVDPVALDRILRLLVSHGVFTRQGTVYSHNEASVLLRSEHPASMRAFARMMGLPIFGDTFAALDHSLAHGAPAIEKVSPGGLWTHLRSHPTDASVFNQAMEAKAQADIGAVVAASDPVPRADCYLLMEIIHDWGDTQALAILSSIRRACSPGATVLVVEGIRDESLDDPRAATLDIIMLAATGGRERTPDELGVLLEEAGFRPTALIETRGAMKLLEATAV